MMRGVIPPGPLLFGSAPSASAWAARCPSPCWTAANRMESGSGRAARLTHTPSRVRWLDTCWLHVPIVARSPVTNQASPQVYGESLDSHLEVPEISGVRVFYPQVHTVT